MSKRGLTKHLKAKHGEETMEIVVGSKMCALCNITYKRNEFHVHMQIYHPESEFLFCCDFCDAKFAKKSKLERHVNIHKLKREKMACSLCSYEAWSQDNLKRHMHRHYNSIKCAICDYTTPEQNNLKRHYNKMHDETLKETSFPCDKCNKYLPSKGALKKHCQRHH